MSLGTHWVRTLPLCAAAWLPHPAMLKNCFITRFHTLVPFSVFGPSSAVQLVSRHSCLAWIVLFSGCILLPDPVFFFFSFFLYSFLSLYRLWVMLFQINPHGVHEVLVPWFDELILSVWSASYFQLNMAVPPTEVGNVWWGFISDSIPKTYTTLSQLNAFPKFTYGY